MSALTEGDLRMQVPDEAVGRRFDAAGHGLSHCMMKAVDFIVELPDRYYFIEMKDPDDPAANAARRKAFIKNLNQAELDQQLTHKYRDSFLYEWASGHADKPVYFLVLVACATLGSPELDRRKDALTRTLPVGVPSVWQREIVAGCAVFNIDTWNRHFPDYQVSRIGSQAGP